MVDGIDHALLAQLQHDATQSYAALGKAVGLSAGSAHERVRKLRERGVIRRTTVEVDPAAVGRGVLAFVMLDANAWMGDAPTRDALAAIPDPGGTHHRRRCQRPGEDPHRDQLPGYLASVLAQRAQSRSASR